MKCLFFNSAGQQVLSFTLQGSGYATHAAEGLANTVSTDNLAAPRGNDPVFKRGSSPVQPQRRPAANAQPSGSGLASARRYVRCCPVTPKLRRFSPESHSPVPCPWPADQGCRSGLFAWRLQGTGRGCHRRWRQNCLHRPGLQRSACDP